MSASTRRLVDDEFVRRQRIRERNVAEEIPVAEERDSLAFVVVGVGGPFRSRQHRRQRIGGPRTVRSSYLFASPKTSRGECPEGVPVGGCRLVIPKASRLSRLVDDWVLKRFAGVSNLPAIPRVLPRGELAAYEGRYVGRAIDFAGDFEETFFDLNADAGQLRMSGQLGMSAAGSQELGLGFYRDDYVLVRDPGGKVDGFRGNFERDAQGRVAWLRLHGRLYERVG